MNVDDDEEYEDIDEESEPQEPPPYEFRISTSKLLIELGNTQVRRAYVLMGACRSMLSICISLCISLCI